MIKTFKSKALAELWSKGSSKKIAPMLQARILLRLDRLDVAVTVAEMDLPGFDFHALKGFKPTRYTAHVNGPWAITFEFQSGDAYAVDLEQYH